MSVLNWLSRIGRAINGEYERRIRAASEVTEYGVGHHDHHGDHAHAATLHHSTHDTQHGNSDGDGAAIVNVRPGTQVGGSRRPHSEKYTSG